MTGAQQPNTGTGQQDWNSVLQQDVQRIQQEKAGAAAGNQNPTGGNTANPGAGAQGANMGGAQGLQGVGGGTSLQGMPGGFQSPTGAVPTAQSVGAQPGSADSPAVQKLAQDYTQAMQSGAQLQPQTQQLVQQTLTGAGVDPQGLLQGQGQNQQQGGLQNQLTGMTNQINKLTG